MFGSLVKMAVTAIAVHELGQNKTVKKAYSDARKKAVKLGEKVYNAVVSDE